jgi:hypothetical protein
MGDIVKVTGASRNTLKEHFGTYWNKVIWSSTG